MANPETDLCFICDQSLKEGVSVIVKERGIQTLLKSSVKRENREHGRILKSLSSVTVHVACQKNYINEKLIAAYLRKKADAPVVASTSRRSSLPRFDFETQCFLCTEEITLDFLKKQMKKSLFDRDVVYRVEKLGVRDTILKAAKERGDEWGRQIIERIQHVTDLVAAEARYHLFCHKRLYFRPPSGQKRGYRPATNVDEAMEYIFTYLADNSEECQFSIVELMDQIEGEYRPDVRTVKSRLLKKYEEDILIIERSNQPDIVCFRDTGYKLLSESWYSAKNLNPEEERLRVVKEAAAIILADIRSQNYNMSEYPPSDRFLNEVNSVIPQSLKLFFQEVIVKKKRGSLDKWNRICESLSHAVISAARPRSFLSSLLIGVSTYLYKKFGSKKLINILSSLGFAASYSETTLFEKSAVVRSETSINENAFSQIICDNADHNVNTIDGLHTVHIMGSIQCVTPHDAVLPAESIPRLINVPSAQVVGEVGSVALSVYHKKQNTGLKTIKIADVEGKHPLSTDILPSTPDFLWLYGKWSKFPVPGWNGFMEQATADKPFMRSKVICLPFINYPPSQYDTINTALLMAVGKCKTSNQSTCFVTFDQPLYAKAQEIVANNPDFTNVIVRLGGFHLLMSFLGAIGYVMNGSGLKELFTTVYAENSVDKMLAGHAYARAIRAHMLCHLALAHVILEYLEFTDDERAIMGQLLGNFDKSVVLTADESEPFRVIATKFKEALTELERNGPTAKLWLQYFQMVTLVKHFITAERMGNWQLHLDTVQRMLPYFHASGHFLYARCGHLYLQDMLNLEERMNPTEYHKFTTEACLTIRRTDKFWAGIWSDMTIEQTMMKMMHSRGGLTRGRGISDSVLALWTLGMISLHNVCDSIEEYCNVYLDTSEQHVDTRTSRITRDDQDLEKLLNWLSQHPPFPEIDSLVSISTGVVGDEKINCHLAREKGIECMSNMIITYENYESIKFKRKDKVIPLAAVNSSMKVGAERITIDPLMLFLRMCIAKKSDGEIRLYLRFELAPFPLSLFTVLGMRKGTKSSLFALFTPLSGDEDSGDHTINVVDGGYLLHKFVWNRNDSFGTTCEKYIQYVRNHYGSNAVVVFDGYPSEDDKKNTKSAERLRRTTKQTSAEVLFDETMTVQVSQERFLANEKNKVRFISMLMNKFEQADFTVKQAEEDADVLIVDTAISFCSSFDAVFIVGEDVDLLVLLTALGSSKDNIFLRKPGRGNTAERVYSSNSLKAKEAAENILFLHAFSGCDTTSSLFNQGKTKFIQLVQKNQELNHIIALFRDPNAKTEDLEDVGARFLVALYGGRMGEETLEDIRYQRFARSSIKNKFNLASLPPTTDAARWHTLRTYHQVQKWCGNPKNPSEWGWRFGTNGLTPVTMSEKPAPDELLNVIACSCKKGCGAACGCRKGGLKCSVVCGFCNGETCENAPEVIIDSDDEDDEIPPACQILTAYNEGVDHMHNHENDEGTTINRPEPSKRMNK